ncbi:hypothetical protein PIB30_011153 [Stylosanthes scabra]|uniref:Uncharacterized protein n=1 Tax=Stylosanthes scabra TaxID=79078 RepID=A0ABU6Q5T2_9FABA|nr:hypothetical protein [Stylosanthes scabra]
MPYSSSSSNLRSSSSDSSNSGSEFHPWGRAIGRGNAEYVPMDGMDDLHSPTRVRSRWRTRKRMGSTLEKQIASSSNKKKMKVLSEVNVENSRLFD